jgi:hypothetical protein
MFHAFGKKGNEQDRPNYWFLMFAYWHSSALFFFFSLVDLLKNDAATFNHSILFRVFWGESFCSKNLDGFCASNQSI